ncbi:MAG: ATP-binding cassette domain-containing protein [Clostridia bacterium]|nr:ATP-binding cassette domain-containing protein [Clostridia bacterium]
MENTQNLLSIVHLKKYFPVSGGIFQRKRFLKANEDVSFDIKAGETFSLVGESGSGKSTLGRTVLGLYKPTSGKVVYYGKEGRGVELTALSEKEFRPLRKDLQIIFQDPYSSLNPRMTVGQIIEEGVATQGLYKRGSEAMREYIFSVLEKCGLQKEAIQRYPHQFSGGQRQRVCIARALAVKPKFIVCDECVSALDASVQSQILNLLTELKEKENLTYLFISHDLSVVRYVSDRVGVMYLGDMAEIGEAEEVFKNPRHPYTIALLASAPSKNKKEEIVLKGNVPSPVSPPSGCKFHTRCFMAKECCTKLVPPLKDIGGGHCVACHFAEVSTREKRNLAKKI